MFAGARKIFAISVCLFALALLAPLTANAQVTVFHVRVTVANNQTATYCDVGLACGPTALSPWNIPAGGIALAPGQTLVLTQTGTIPVAPAPNFGSNFDTSERIRPAGAGIDQTQDCFAPTSNACTTNIFIDTGSGLQLVYSNASGNELTAFNQDSGANTFQEARPWSAPVFSNPNYTLSLGYADNVHGPPQCTVNCTPTPFANATVFLGASLPAAGQCGTPPCWDAGALLITGVAHQLITVTQGGWGAPPNGNNPGALLADNFSTVFPTGITLGCPAGTKLVFTSAAQIEAFLPSGGKPGPLPDTNVLTGQLLAATLNVGFSNAGVLPPGLGGMRVASGPFAGKTVNQVIAMANRVIGGCPIAGDIVDYPALNTVLTGINEAFDEGGNTGFLIP